MGCGCSSFDGGYNNAEGKKLSKESIKGRIKQLENWLKRAGNTPAAANLRKELEKYKNMLAQSNNESTTNDSGDGEKKGLTLTQKGLIGLAAMGVVSIGAYFIIKRFRN